MKKNLKVLVTGGAGYVGSALVPALLARGHRVRVLDLYMFGDDALDAVRYNPDLEQIEGDVRDRDTGDRAVDRCDAVIHLASISNDPSFAFDPALGKSINYDCFAALVDSAQKADVRRFIYTSSSSVYGVNDEPNVTEDLPLAPLTEYAKYKAKCEDLLLQMRKPGMAVLILRPAMVCGYSPRLRLDLSVNILTHHAVKNRKITVSGGDQKQPNIHIADLCDLYVQSLEWPVDKIDGQIFNAGWDNLTLDQIAQMVQRIVGPDVAIERTPAGDKQSYHISSEKIRREVGFAPTHNIEDAVRDLVAAFANRKIPNPGDDRYYNVKTLQNLNMK